MEPDSVRSRVKFGSRCLSDGRCRRAGSSARGRKRDTRPFRGPAGRRTRGKEYPDRRGAHDNDRGHQEYNQTRRAVVVACFLACGLVERTARRSA